MTDAAACMTHDTGIMPVVLCPEQSVSATRYSMLTNVGIFGQPVDLILILISETEGGVLVLTLRQPVGLYLGGEHREAIPSIQRGIIRVHVHPCITSHILCDNGSH